MLGPVLRLLPIGLSTVLRLLLSIGLGPVLLLPIRLGSMLFQNRVPL